MRPEYNKLILEFRPVEGLDEEMRKIVREIRRTKPEMLARDRLARIDEIVQIVPLPTGKKEAA